MSKVGIRRLSDRFLVDLRDADGLLHPILERVMLDHTLMLAIRDGYINIYYRGGNLLRLRCHGKDHSYRPFFDPQYDKSGQWSAMSLPTTITGADDVASWLEALPHLKQIMDFYFAVHNKPEREFQQLMARENSYSSISNETEYFIVDIEFADSGLGARFDMLAVRWLAPDRKSSRNCRLALMEMKYGDNALGAVAGLADHLKDIDQFVRGEGYKLLVQSVNAQFTQLDQLGLLRFNRSPRATQVMLEPEDRPEVIVVLANHNPRSTRLARVLQDLQEKGYGESPEFDLRFFVASCAGYGMHADCLLPLTDFQRLLRIRPSIQDR